MTTKYKNINFLLTIQNKYTIHIQRAIKIVTLIMYKIERINQIMMTKETTKVTNVCV